jgi:hypothetical protein
MISSNCPSRTAPGTEVKGSAPPTMPTTGLPAARPSGGREFSSVQSAPLHRVRRGSGRRLAGPVCCDASDLVQLGRAATRGRRAGALDLARRRLRAWVSAPRAQAHRGASKLRRRRGRVARLDST